LAHVFHANSVQVYLNGVRQALGADYYESPPQEVVFLVPPVVNDIVTLDYEKNF
jgi:hypothetical protein